MAVPAHTYEQVVEGTMITLLSDAWSTQVTLLKQEGDGERDGDDNTTTKANNEGNGEDGADDDQDGDMAAESRPGIQARLRKAPGVIVADTGDNRPQRTRATTNIYQAATKKEVKKPGRGRGRR